MAKSFGAVLARLGLGTADSPGSRAGPSRTPETPTPSPEKQPCREADAASGKPRPAEPLDAWTRIAAQPLVGPGAAPPPSPSPATASPPALGLELVQLEQLVRSLAWGGTRRRGVARLVLAAGELAGARVDIHVDGREVQLDLDGPCGPVEQAWRERVAQRLEARGFVVRVAS